MSAIVTGDYTIGQAGGAPSTLLNGLVAFWKLDEASGTRNDSVGSNHLTDNNTVTQAAGKSGNAAQFTSANNESLSIADNTDLSTGDIDFTFGLWVYFDDVGSNHVPLSKWNDTGPDYEYWLGLLGGVLTFYVRDAANTALDNIPSAASISVSTWYFIVIWHDSVANTINIQVNNGTPASKSYSAGVRNGTASFFIGGQENLINYHSGRGEDVGFWKRVLTSDERTELWNGGAGREHPFS
jgi:hypothetical protein